jgi:hypothetical protein
MTDTNNNRDVARDVFWRYFEVYQRGHQDFMRHVRRLEDYYLGGGRQWRQEDRAVVEGEGRPCHEVNVIQSSVNAAAGYQIANRVDVSFLPKGGRGDEQTAKLLGKVAKHVFDNASYRQHETDAFLDGMIQQRGYLDLRMGYDDSDLGELTVRTIDPMDGMPDPDAKGYDPDTWADWRETRWLTQQEIEGFYGRDAAEEVVAKSLSYVNEDNFGTEYVHRQGFGEMPPSYSMGQGWYEDAGRHRRYRIIDEQTNVYERTLVARWPTGDLRIVEGYPREHLAWLIDQGVAIVHRRMRRVRWRVCAPDVCFIDRLSPYEHITAVPFFPYFRRGRTVGMVDNMTSPQDMLNKFISQYATVVNSSANGGWQGEANVLQNMTDDEFTENGAKNGIVLLREKGTKPFEKIQPNQIPTGLDRMIDFAHANLQVTSGVDENLAGASRDGMSGAAIQSLQYASQQKLAVALDNLSRTRQMVYRRGLKLIQRYMGNERIIRITEVDSYGVEHHVPLHLNSIQPDGQVLNDLTIGEYDVAVSERPAQVTFDNSEFEQIKAMRKEMGIAIPDAVVVRASTLADKSEIAQSLQAAATPAPDVEAEANAELLRAKAAESLARAKKADNEAVAKSIEAQYSAIQTAQAIVVTPASAAIADALLRSGGYVDNDAAPIVPGVPPGLPSVPPETNTNPLTPANPAVGLTQGMSDSPLNPPV